MSGITPAHVTGARAGAGGGGGVFDAREEEEEGEGAAAAAHPAPPPPAPHSPRRPVYFLGRQAVLLDVLDVTAAEKYLREISRSCVGLCRESACLPGSSYQPMLLTLLAKEVAGLGEGWKNGTTRLHHAAETGNAARVRTLVQAGTEVDVQNAFLLTPLMGACYKGQEEVARLLLELGACHALRTEGGYSPLAYAALGGSVSCVRLLAQSGADVDAVTESGHTPLIRAVMERDDDVARELLDLGASHALKSRDGHTALWWAASYGLKSFVRLLVQRGGDVNASDGGESPLIAASKMGMDGVAHMLLKAGASHAHRDVGGCTPLWHAARCGRWSVVGILAQWGADIDAVDNDGWSPLMAACESGVDLAVSTLIRLGAADGLVSGSERAERARQAAGTARAMGLDAQADAILARLPPPAPA